MTKPFSSLTDSEILSFNEFQASGAFHPYTCPECGRDLFAIRTSLQCPGCPYYQNHVLDFLIDGSWRNMQVKSWGNKEKEDV
jgi:uncharacterized Zn finger protein (UPF0148 family)